jgi:hypothetical protein
MSTIPECFLPSNPDCVVRLRMATIEDSIDFCNVHEFAEEEKTTLFLETIQDKATYSNPKKWTGDDRRFVLFWYWIHSNEIHDLMLTFSYQCAECGEEHSVAITQGEIVNSLTAIQGKPERDITVDELKLTVRPLDGAALEELEAMQMQYLETVEEFGEHSKEAQHEKAKNKFAKLLFSVAFPEEEKNEAKDRVAYREEKLLKLPFTTYSKLVEEHKLALKGMQHGLRTTFKNGQLLFVSDLKKCPNNPDSKGVSLTFPFRIADYIPQI